MSTPPIIIIAEPDSLFRDSLRVEFESAYFVVMPAETPREAEVFAAQTIASLVVLDTDRAALAAFEACARIRRRPGYAARPIVLTGHDASDRMLSAAKTAGATAVLPKPYSFLDFHRALASSLPDDDPLIRRGAGFGGVGERKSVVWGAGPIGAIGGGSDSALTRNGRLLPIMRTAGVKIPLRGKVT